MQQRQLVDADITDANRDSADACSDARSRSDANADTYSDADAGANTNSNADSHTDANSNSNSNSNADADADADTHTDAHAYSGARRQLLRDVDGNIRRGGSNQQRSATDDMDGSTIWRECDGAV